MDDTTKDALYEEIYAALSVRDYETAADKLAQYEAVGGDHTDIVDDEDLPVDILREFMDFLLDDGK